MAVEIENGVRAGYKVAVPTWATIIPFKDDIMRLGQYSLDAGEVAVIQLAIEQGVKDACIDEWRGRFALCTLIGTSANHLDFLPFATI